MKTVSDMLSALDQRCLLTERLVTALDRFDMDEAVGIVSSFIPLAELEDLVIFQERDR